MNAVITADQARQVLGGRAPLVPVEYETAVKALAECITLDEAKYWDNKADALAAWAKIYRSDDAGRKARQLKLHAFRRMGELATELARQRPRRPGLPPTNKILMESGLLKSQANAATHLARLPADEFNLLTERPRVPTPNSVRESSFAGSEAWKEIRHDYGSPMIFRAFCRSHPAAEFARQLTSDEAKKALEIITEIIEWCDEFERHLRAVSK